MKLGMYSTALVALSLSLFAVTVTGCGGGDGAIAVEPAKTPLSDNPGDTLFTLKVEEARDGGYALDGLEVKVTPDGKDAAVSVSCVPADANANGKLDTSETLACNEGTANVFGVAHAGKEAEVELFAKVDGVSTRVGSATWKP